MRFLRRFSLRWHFPLSLTNWPYLAVKAGLASAMALELTRLLHVRDGISACFLACTSTTPSATAGFRNGAGQLVASLLGGTVAASILGAGVSGPAAMLSSISATVILVGLLHREKALTVALFTAVYLVNVAERAPLGGLIVRMESLTLGALSAFVVNVAVSVVAYGKLFDRRLRICRWAMEKAAQAPSHEEWVHGWLKAHALIVQLQSELTDAERDRWLYGKKTQMILQKARSQAESLAHEAQKAQQRGFSSAVVGHDVDLHRFGENEV